MVWIEKKNVCKGIHCIQTGTYKIFFVEKCGCYIAGIWVLKWRPVLAGVENQREINMKKDEALFQSFHLLHLRNYWENQGYISSGIRVEEKYTLIPVIKGSCNQ